MIRNHRKDPDRGLVEAPGEAPDPQAVWIDLLRPTPAEEQATSALIGAAIPAPETAREIEISSRIYIEGAAGVMTLPVLTTSGEFPALAYITLVLTEERLVSVRNDDPAAMRAFAAKAARRPELGDSAAETFAGLADAVSDRVADQLEEAGAELDALGRRAFEGEAGSRDLEAMLKRLGRKGDLLAKARETLVGLSRTISFARTLGAVKRRAAAARTLKTVARDVTLLIQHADALSARVAFLLDSTLGMISVEQNAIIKIFSVVAAIFLPPTLIASIYGMNFEHMPELGWPYAYPLALAAMAASMAAPYLWFRRRGWI